MHVGTNELWEIYLQMRAESPQMRSGKRAGGCDQKTLDLPSCMVGNMTVNIRVNLEIKKGS